MNLMPQEIEVWYILPAIRSELAKNMFDKGLKQKEVAKILGIGNSAVCQYLKKKRANEINFNDKIKKEIKESSDKIIKNKTCAIREIQHICAFIKQSGFLCSIHKKYNEVCSQCRQSI